MNKSHANRGAHFSSSEVGRSGLDLSITPETLNFFLNFGLSIPPNLDPRLFFPQFDSGAYPVAMLHGLVPPAEFIEGRIDPTL